jgi:hypothetical protein
MAATSEVFRALVEAASDIIAVVAPDLTMVFQAASDAHALWYRPKDLEGTKFGALVDPSGLRELRAACAGAADGVAHPASSIPRA